MAKAQRYNLCPPLRFSLEAGGYSVYKIVCAINAEIGNCEIASEEAELGKSSIKRAKKDGTPASYNVTETEKRKLKSEVTEALLLDVFNCKLNEAYKLANFEQVEIPAVFLGWLNRFAKNKTEQVEEQVEEQTRA